MLSKINESDEETAVGSLGMYSVGIWVIIPWNVRDLVNNCCNIHVCRVSLPASTMHYNDKYKKLQTALFCALTRKMLYLYN